MKIFRFLTVGETWIKSDSTEQVRGTKKIKERRDFLLTKEFFKCSLCSVCDFIFLFFFAVQLLLEGLELEIAPLLHSSGFPKPALQQPRLRGCPVPPLGMIPKVPNT